MGSCALKFKVEGTKMGKLWLTLVIGSFLLLEIVQCQRKDNEGEPDPPVAAERNQFDKEPQDAIDTGAWLANWLAAVGSYASRQELPWRRRYEGPVEDLPNIYIPNELTGNEIVRALKLTGKKQMVVEENEYLDFLNFHVMQKNDFEEDNDTSEYDDYGYQRPRKQIILAPYIDEEDGYFVLDEDFINSTMGALTYPINDNFTLYSQLGDNVTEAIREILEETRVKKSHQSWDDMVEDIDRLYKQMMSILEKKNLARMTEDGFYTITKSGIDMVHNVVNATVFQSVENYEYR